MKRNLGASGVILFGILAVTLAISGCPGEEEKPEKKEETPIDESKIVKGDCKAVDTFKALVANLC